MEQNALKNVNNCLNTNIYSYLETSGGQSSNYSKKWVWPSHSNIYFLSSILQVV